MTTKRKPDWAIKKAAVLFNKVIDDMGDAESCERAIARALRDAYRKGWNEAAQSQLGRLLDIKERAKNA